MPQTVYYNQECPTCGRSLRIRVEYQGRHVVCQHCNGKFQALDPANNQPLPSDSGIALMRRADELLEMASHASLRQPRY